MGNGRRLDEYANIDMVARDPAAQQDDYEAPGSVRAGSLEGNRLYIDSVVRVSYTAPPTGGTDLPLYTVTQTITRGWIVAVGIGSPQFDFFGTNMYYLAINGTAPYNQIYQIIGGPPAGAGAGSFFGFCPVGTVVSPRPVKIPIKTNDNVSLRIAPQATPAAGTVVYNLFVRTIQVLER